MEKIVLYSSVVSQWASVPLLGLIEKQYQPEEYEVIELDFLNAEHLTSEYLKVNKNGTVPTLVAPGLASPLIESTDILEYLEKSHAERGTSLAPGANDTEVAMRKLIDLVHSDDLHTSMIYWGARNVAEMETVRSQHLTFFNARRLRLDENRARFPQDKDFWGPKILDNDKLVRLCSTPVGDEHREYFKSTEERYQKFVAAFGELETALVLPWAAGEQLTYADLHMAPWLSHAMRFAGSQSIEDLDSLEAWMGQSVKDFRVGPKIREWWGRMIVRESFREVFPVLR